MTVLAHLTHVLGWPPRCRIVQASAEGPLFHRRAPRPADRTASARLVPAER